MKYIFIAANWKANNVAVREWLERLKILISDSPIEERKKIIICPPFTLLAQTRYLISTVNLSLSLGAQNISQFPLGAHTGEETGEMLKNLAQYVIIGHSERRAMGETEEEIGAKLDKAWGHGLIPILCVSQISEIEHQFSRIKINGEIQNIIIAFEPLQAIGSGNPDTPEHAAEFAGQVKSILGEVDVLYGGSVKGENVHLFTSQTNISGVLVGGASLQAESFYAIIKNS